MNPLSLIAPQWAAKRARSRMLLAQYEEATARLEKAGNKLRSYDAASRGRRMGRWLATDSGPAGANGQVLGVLRERTRDLVRNNGYMSTALQNIQAETIGTGIIPRIGRGGNARLRSTWKDWAESTDCDADGRLTYYGMQSLWMGELFESGEVLIRLRRRKMGDGLPVPIQLQTLEPDYLADDKMGLGGESGNIRSGIGFDRRGKRSSYHIYKQHPSTFGAPGMGFSMDTVRVGSEEMIHLYRVDRAGQIRGVPWPTSVITRIRLLDDYEDAALERQRVAACFAAFITDPDELGSPKVEVDADGNEIYPTERLEPGIVEHLAPGREVTFGTPPSDTGYEKTVETNLRIVARGTGLTYEMLTGDLSKVNFTSGRMGNQQTARLVNGWRQNILKPHACDGVMKWFMDAARVQGLVGTSRVQVRWTPPQGYMVDPTKETAALKEQVRGGFISMPEAIRRLGGDPDETLEEIKAWNKKLDKAEVTLDTDPRSQSAAGQKQGNGNEQEDQSEDPDDADADSGDAAEAAE